MVRFILWGGTPGLPLLSGTRVYDRKEKQMFEYVAVAGGDIQNWWTGDVLPVLDMVRSSPYFWPGVLAASLIVLLAMRNVVR